MVQVGFKFKIKYTHVKNFLVQLANTFNLNRCVIVEEYLSQKKGAFMEAWLIR